MSLLPVGGEVKLWTSIITARPWDGNAGEPLVAAGGRCLRLSADSLSSHQGNGTVQRGSLSVVNRTLGYACEAVYITEFGLRIFSSLVSHNNTRAQNAALDKNLRSYIIL